LSPTEKARRARLAAEEARQKELDMRMGATDWSALKKELTKKFGSVTAAWRNGLDSNGNGKLSFLEFSKACRDMGFLGNVQKIFKELDNDDSGIITFDEVDPTWFARLTSFSNLLLAKYSTYEGAWRALDDNKNNMLEEQEMQDVCQSIGYNDSTPKALFNQLRQSTGLKYLSLQDIECLSSILVGVLTSGGKESNEQLSPKVFARRDEDLISPQDKAKAELKDRQELRRAVTSECLAADTTASLKKLLVRKYGSITAAWRYGLDFSSSGKCSFQDFSKACRDIGFTGNVKAVFNELNTDQKKGIITFEELDKGWYDKLNDFSQKIEEQFGNLANSMKVFDENGNNMIEVEELEHVCQKIGYTGNPEKLFNQLRADPSKKFITMEDVDAKGVIAWAAHRFDQANNSPTSPKREKSSNLALDAKAQLSRSQEMSHAVDHSHDKNKRY